MDCLALSQSADLDEVVGFGEEEGLMRNGS